VANGGFREFAAVSLHIDEHTVPALGANFFQGILEGSEVFHRRFSRRSDRRFSGAPAPY
jgi:hypothetical protein